MVNFSCFRCAIDFHVVQANITFTAPQCPQCGGRPQRSFRRAKRGP